MQWCYCVGTPNDNESQFEDGFNNLSDIYFHTMNKHKNLDRLDSLAANYTIVTTSMIQHYIGR